MISMTNWIKFKENLPVEISPYGGEKLSIRFPCSECGNYIFCNTVMPISSDLSKDHEETKQEEILCKTCNITYSLEITNFSTGLNLYSENIEPDSIEFKIAKRGSTG